MRRIRLAPEPRDTRPPRGLPLGLTLGLVLALTVSVVLGVITGIDQHRELTMERAMRQARLEERLAELRDEFAVVARPTELPSALASMRTRLERENGTGHGLELCGAAGGRTVVAAPGGVFVPPPDALLAMVEVDCPVLDGGTGRLAAWQSGAALAADRSRLWREWIADLLLTSFAVIVVVELAVHLLVGRPLKRLVGGLRRLEQGHMGSIEPGPGAWEIRWLAWRFERLGLELADDARRLVAAERRALDATRLLATNRERGLGAPSGLPADEPAAPEVPSAQSALARQYLQDTCRLLKTLDADEPVAHEIAEEAWTTAVVEAERVGDRDLKAQLEDAALRILEQRDFAELDAALAELRQRRLPWSRWVGERLSEAVGEVGVTVIEIQHRVKHTAGVWRKMREAQIAVDQVHDLFAFRIIVPTEPDCYLALAAVHRSFDPEPFRFKDYIDSPKPNGYRSLHTTVRDADDRLFEVQIRTPEMHEIAEAGGAAHWRYRVERWGSLASLRPRPAWYRRWIEARRRPAS